MEIDNINRARGVLHVAPEKIMTIKEKRKELKKAGAIYTPNIGWAFPDDDGTVWFDNSSYNHTVFLGANAEEAWEELHKDDWRDHPCVS